jgi:hypothetical protein
MRTNATDSINVFISPNKQSSGMNKREYFAALAMQSINKKTNYNENEIKKKEPEKDAASICKISVQYADALIKALNEVP